MSPPFKTSVHLIDRLKRDNRDIYEFLAALMRLSDSTQASAVPSKHNDNIAGVLCHIDSHATSFDLFPVESTNDACVNTVISRHPLVAGELHW
jgi:hypothetical protein